MRVGFPLGNLLYAVAAPERYGPDVAHFPLADQHTCLITVGMKVESKEEIKTPAGFLSDRQSASDRR